MTTSEWLDQLERELWETAEVWTRPEPRECLACFVARMVEEFGCDTSLRWATRFRDLRVPRAVALARRLGERGAFCDCEIFLNTTELRAEFYPFDEEDPPEGWRPTCLGVRGGTVLPCGLWHRRRKW